MKKKWITMTGALLMIGAVGAQAQVASDTRIRVTKDTYTTSTMTSEGDIDYIAYARTVNEWYRPTGTVCSGVDMEEVRRVQIESDLYNPATMISPDSAKMIALCAVPGQIGSGEMEVNNGRTENEGSIIPNGKPTYTKVVVDGQTGRGLCTKQFGGVRGGVSWLREGWGDKIGRAHG